MEIEKFLEMMKNLEKKKKTKAEELEKLQAFFERFHNLNRAYLERETFEKARDSISAIAEAIANTIQFLDSEITRLRNKRMKLPFENVELAQMQKVQKKNELMIKEFMAGEKE
jgi:C-terminal processing protease CtpA/Prc